MAIPNQGVRIYALLSLSPLSPSRRIFLARLACLIHAANVHSEPGSNPSNPEAEAVGDVGCTRGGGYGALARAVRAVEHRVGGSACLLDDASRDLGRVVDVPGHAAAPRGRHGHDERAVRLQPRVEECLAQCVGRDCGPCSRRHRTWRCGSTRAADPHRTRGGQTGSRVGARPGRRSIRSRRVRPVRRARRNDRSTRRRGPAPIRSARAGCARARRRRGRCAARCAPQLSAMRRVILLMCVRRFMRRCFPEEARCGSMEVGAWSGCSLCAHTRSVAKKLMIVCAGRW
jgi:hypothetical protein